MTTLFHDDIWNPSIYYSLRFTTASSIGLNHTYNVSSTRQHESSRTRASSTGDSLISCEVSYTGWTLSTGFGSEFASRCSDVCTRWLLNTWLPIANPSPASLAVATCDRLTVVISISHVWNLLRTEDVHLHTPALQIGTTYLRDSSLSLSSFKRHLKTFLFSFI